MNSQIEQITNPIIQIYKQNFKSLLVLQDQNKILLDQNKIKDNQTDIVHFGSQAYLVLFRKKINLDKQLVELAQKHNFVLRVIKKRYICSGRLAKLKNTLIQIFGQFHDAVGIPNSQNKSNDNKKHGSNANNDNNNDNKDDNTKQKLSFNQEGDRNVINMANKKYGEEQIMLDSAQKDSSPQQNNNSDNKIVKESSPAFFNSPETYKKIQTSGFASFPLIQIVNDHSVHNNNNYNITNNNHNAASPTTSINNNSFSEQKQSLKRIEQTLETQQQAVTEQNKKINQFMTLFLLQSQQQAQQFQAQWLQLQQQQKQKTSENMMLAQENNNNNNNNTPKETIIEIAKQICQEGEEKTRQLIKEETVRLRQELECCKEQTGTEFSTLQDKILKMEQETAAQKIENMTEKAQMDGLQKRFGEMEQFMQKIYELNVDRVNERGFNPYFSNSQSKNFRAKHELMNKSRPLSAGKLK